MTIIISGNEDGGLTVFDSLGDAKVGRWCAALQVPDRCDKCWDPDTLLHYEAEAYREETDPHDGTIWRYGTCHRCDNAISGTT